MPAEPLFASMYRYRLLNEATGADLGPLVSSRLTFTVGETLARAGERFGLVRVVAPENENFRAYLIVRPDAEARSKRSA